MKAKLPREGSTERRGARPLPRTVPASRLGLLSRARPGRH